MDLRTATQMEKFRRQAVAISAFLVLALLGIATTFIALNVVHNDDPAPTTEQTPVGGPNLPVVTATWVLPVDAEQMTVLKAADFNLVQKNATAGWYEFDLGYTLGAAANTAVVACADGTVTNVVEDGDASTGKLIRIAHKNGLETVYSSLGSVQVKVGDKVQRGDQIGTVGNTAHYELFEQPHVRLLAYKNGKPVNPEEYLDFPGSGDK